MEPARTTHDDKMERLIQRARTLLGYMTPLEACVALLSTTTTPEEAALSVKAAKILNGDA